jgi:hypothetical protein
LALFFKFFIDTFMYTQITNIVLGIVDLSAISYKSMR